MLRSIFLAIIYMIYFLPQLSEASTLSSIVTRQTETVQIDTPENFKATLGLAFSTRRGGVGGCVANCTFLSSKITLFDAARGNWSASFKLRNEFGAFGDDLYIDDLEITHIIAPHAEPKFTLNLNTFNVLSARIGSRTNPPVSVLGRTSFTASANHPPASHAQNNYRIQGFHISDDRGSVFDGGIFSIATVIIEASHTPGILPPIPLPASGTLLLGLLGLLLVSSVRVRRCPSA